MCRIFPIFQILWIYTSKKKMKFWVSRGRNISKFTHLTLTWSFRSLFANLYAVTCIFDIICQISSASSEALLIKKFWIYYDYFVVQDISFARVYWTLKYLGNLISCCFNKICSSKLRTNTFKHSFLDWSKHSDDFSFWNLCVE